MEKTHYRKAFDSPYLGSHDIVGQMLLTISRVELSGDKTKKTKTNFNTAFFVETEIRPGEKLKPMILNATNSRTIKNLTGSPFINDWNNIPITIYVDNKIRFGRNTVEGLRISTEPPRLSKPELTPTNPSWGDAITAYKRDGHFDAIEQRMIIADVNKEAIKVAANEMD